MHNWEIAQGNTIWLALAGVLLVTFIVIGLLTKLPLTLRRPLLSVLVFVSGLFYALEYFLPTHMVLDHGVLVPENFLTDLIPNIINPLAQDLSALLFGLGLFSLIRMHFNNVVRQRSGWVNSLALLVSTLSMMVFGFWSRANLHHPQWVDQVYHHLFDGVYQNMDAAMFSLIAFFILSASYRAFRIRSFEASILMTSALIVLLGLSFGGLITDKVPDYGLWSNFRIETWSSWILNIISSPGLRAIDFGVGLGGLAMGLRIWLGIEKGALFGD
jgi:hypothetical protein